MMLLDSESLIRYICLRSGISSAVILLIVIYFVLIFRSRFYLSTIYFYDNVTLFMIVVFDFFFHIKNHLWTDISTRRGNP